MRRSSHGTPTLRVSGCAIWRAGRLWAVVGPDFLFVARSLAEAVAVAARK